MMRFLAHHRRWRALSTFSVLGAAVAASTAPVAADTPTGFTTQHNAISAAPSGAPGDFWADGTSLQCGTPVPTSCSALYHSADGGHSWQRVQPTTYDGQAPVLLAPSYPTDPVMFAADLGDLLRSGDGGKTWVPVAPAELAAAVDPTSPAGDARVLIGLPQPLIYDDASRTVTTGPTLPETMSSVGAVAYAGDSQHLLFGGITGNAATGNNVTHIVRCVRGACADVLVQPGIDGPIVFDVSPNFAADQTVFAWDFYHAWLSTNGGASFTELATGLPNIRAAAIGASAGCAPVCIIASTVNPSNGGLETNISANGGASFSPTGAPLTGGAGMVPYALAIGLDGHIVAGVSGVVAELLCSSDLAATWNTAC